MCFEDPKRKCSAFVAYTVNEAGAVFSLNGKIGVEGTPQLRLLPGPVPKAMELLASLLAKKVRAGYVLVDGDLLNRAFGLHGYADGVSLLRDAEVVASEKMANHRASLAHAPAASTGPPTLDESSAKPASASPAAAAAAPTPLELPTSREAQPATEVPLSAWHGPPAAALDAGPPPVPGPRAALEAAPPTRSAVVEGPVANSSDATAPMDGVVYGPAEEADPPGSPAAAAREARPRPIVAVAAPAAPPSSRAPSASPKPVPCEAAPSPKRRCFGNVENDAKRIAVEALVELGAVRKHAVWAGDAAGGDFEKAKTLWYSLPESNGARPAASGKSALVTGRRGRAQHGREASSWMMQSYCSGIAVFVEALTPRRQPLPARTAHRCSPALAQRP